MTEHSVIEIWQKSAWKSALFFVRKLIRHDENTASAVIIKK